MGENEILHDSVTDFILLDIKTRLIRSVAFADGPYMEYVS